MALVKKFELNLYKVRWSDDEICWYADWHDGHPDECRGRGENDDLNRAIVMCVAKMWIDRTARETSTVAQDK